MARGVRSFGDQRVADGRGSHAAPWVTERLLAGKSGSARSLADMVDRWRPGVLPYGRQVTVRQLLNHTRGCPTTSRSCCGGCTRPGRPGSGCGPRGSGSAWSPTATGLPARHRPVLVEHRLPAGRDDRPGGHRARPRPRSSPAASYGPPCQAGGTTRTGPYGSKWRKSRGHARVAPMRLGMRTASERVRRARNETTIICRDRSMTPGTTDVTMADEYGDLRAEPSGGRTSVS